MTRYALRAMTLEDAHKQGFSTRWFDERALTRDEINQALLTYEANGETVWALDALVSWPTGDKP